MFTNVARTARWGTTLYLGRGYREGHAHCEEEGRDRVVDFGGTKLQRVSIWGAVEVTHGYD